MKLSKVAVGRDNNFNLIRIVAALAVLVTHSFALAIGTDDAEPFQESLGMTLGSIAVDVFFITSGFLVTASLSKRKSSRDFIIARVLRIYPALSVVVFLTVFGIGVVFTSLPFKDYLLAYGTYFYLIKCMTLIFGVAFNLPGVFETNPFENSVNGSLWTLPYEVRMYSILLLSWIALGAVKNYRVKAFKLVIVASACAAGMLVLVAHFFIPLQGEFTKLFFMFFSGAAFYVLKDRLVLDRRVFWLFSAMLVLAAFAGKHLFFIAYNMTITYIIIYIAYVPSGLVRKYNRVGDYSYGVYIYAFPVQQTTVALVPDVSVLTLLSISASITMIMAIVSWHLLEKRAIRLKTSLRSQLTESPECPSLRNQ